MYGAFSLPDWATADGVTSLVWWLYWLVVIAVAVTTAFLSGVASRVVAAVLFREISSGAVTRIRLLGGVGGAIVAYVLLGTVDWGAGLGTGNELGITPERTEAVTQPDPSKPPEEPPPPTEPKNPLAADPKQPASVVYLALLGEGTDPPYQPKNRFFAFMDETPRQPLDVDEVMRRLAERQKRGKITEVELVVSPQSTSLYNLEVQRLRRALAEAGLRFYAPDPDRPFPKDETR